MQFLIVGSTAMRAIYGSNLVRQPLDLDIFSPDPGRGEGEDMYWHEALASWITPDTRRYATPDELLTIKVSHSPWELKNGSWLKHMSDIVFLQDQGAKVDQALHDLLYRVWIERYGKKKTTLAMEKGAFFQDAVVRIYDHDSIHASVAYADYPAYLDVMKDGQTVLTDMKKVWALDESRRQQLFREEIYATALERKVIPSDYQCSPRSAYAWALRRTITSLTKGKSAQYLIENYRIFRDPDCDYVQRHLDNKHHLIYLANKEDM